MNQHQAKGRLVVLSGPSGVGKDTVLEQLVRDKPSWQRVGGYTTRPRRPGELDGREYSFVDIATFQEMEAGKQFLETALVHGNHYGTSRTQVEQLLAQGQDVLLKLDVQGARQLREAGVEAVFIFLAPPSREVLLERLRRRETESADELARRSADADRELAEAHWYHHVVVNDDVARAASEVAAILEGPS
ncbi:MAG TPA: guanylate kinase [Candidatus Dormibacteraeota bacterium]